MADYENFAERIQAYKCPGTALAGLTPAQRTAVHAFKVEFEAALRKLYRSMDPKAADDFVKHPLKQLVE